MDAERPESGPAAEASEQQAEQFSAEVSGNALEAHQRFDRREEGWIKTVLAAGR